MRKIFCIIAIICLLGCSGQKKGKNNTVIQIPESDTIPLKMENTSEYFDKRKFLDQVNTFSTEELKELINKTEPECAGDFFILIPDTCFIFPFTPEERRQMLKGKAQRNEALKVDVYDKNNNYLALNGYEGKWEMFVQTINPKLWRILVNMQLCGETCYTTKALEYIYEDGNLYHNTDDIFKEYMKYPIDLFLCRDRFNDQEWENIKNKCTNDEEISMFKILFDLPRDGKTMKIYIDGEIFVQNIVNQEYTKTIEKDISIK